MIDLKSLLHTVQEAVDVAVHAVARQNIELFKSYFRAAPTPRGTLTAGEGPGVVAQVAAVAQSAATSEAVSADDLQTLVPQYIRLQFDRDSPRGPVAHEVSVPLISLVPFASLQPTEFNLEMDLECVEQEGELMISFPKSKRTWLGGEKTIETRPNAKLTIKVNAASRPAGVTAIIEGYDKVLRAQIPN